jgi:hypothetical protein
MQLFYNGLKEDVKDKLYKVDRPNSLNEYIGIAIWIDERLYTWKQQCRGQGSIPQAYRANKRQLRRGNTSYGTYLGRMDVDTT